MSKMWRVFLFEMKHIINHLIKKCNYLRVKGWEKIFQSNAPKEQVGVTILIPNKIDFKLTSIKRDGERHFILIQEKSIKTKSQFWTSMPQRQEHPHM